MTQLDANAQPMAGFDIESTGVSVDADRIVTAALVVVGPASFQHSWLVNPGIPIPAPATAVHGITDAQAQTGEPAFQAVDQIAEMLADTLRVGNPVVCANAPFDLTILDRECRRYMLPTLEERVGAVAPVIDVQVLDKHLDPYRKGKRTLEALCAHYGVKLDGAHDAAADTLGALRLAWRLLQDPALGQISLPELHNLQVEWRAEQQRSLRKYFAKQGRTEDAATVDEHWPYRPYRPETEPML